MPEAIVVILTLCIITTLIAGVFNCSISTLSGAIVEIQQLPQSMVILCIYRDCYG